MERELIEDAKRRMDKTLEVLRKGLASVRTGRASLSILDGRAIWKLDPKVFVDPPRPRSSTTALDATRGWGTNRLFTALTPARAKLNSPSGPPLPKLSAQSSSA